MVRRRSRTCRPRHLGFGVVHFKEVNCYLRMSKSNREEIMGIFGDIMSKIFGQSAKAETPAARTAAPSASTAPQASPAPSGTMTRTGPAPEGPKVEWSAPVDVKAVLRELAKSKKQKLNYDKSIVDLLKLLDLDSSLTARQELAKELGYSGNTKGSSKMNVWLHKEVMRQLAANGGKVPKTWMA
jgi:hypothetical protein